MSGYLFLLPPIVLLGLAAVVIIIWLVIRFLCIRRHKRQGDRLESEQEKTDAQLEN